MPQSPPEPEASVRDAILSLLDDRAAASSICPSEAARRAYSGSDDGWRALMPLVRDVAAGLAEQGLIEATQRGKKVNAVNAKGPIRLRRHR